MSDRVIGGGMLIDATMPNVCERAKCAPIRNKLMG